MIHKISEAHLPIPEGDFKISVFHNDLKQELLVLSKEPFSETPLVRIHSSCMTGDIFSSKRCDCGAQLHQALQLIADFSGVLIYLSQEGRGIGLGEKIRAYRLQEQGYDTVEANLQLGHLPDQRDYEDAIHILKFFEIQKLQLLTNNPNKITALQKAGFEVQRQALISPVTSENQSYLRIKQEKLGHFLND